MPMIERTMEMTNQPLKDVLVDSGYPSGEDLAECQKKGVTVYATVNENSFTEAKRAKGGEKRQISKDRFVFDPSGPSYRCPEGKQLTYRERSKNQKANGDYFTIEIYQADPSDSLAVPSRPGACVVARELECAAPGTRGSHRGIKAADEAARGQGEVPPAGMHGGATVRRPENAPRAPEVLEESVNDSRFVGLVYTAHSGS